MASGKPLARPVKPSVMWLGSNGVKLRWPAFWMITTTDTTTRTSISKPKKAPASLVETPTPRIIITMAPAVRMTDRIPQGTFHLK